MFAEPWFLIALACSFGGYATYLLSLRRHLVQPSRASWLIWSASTGVEAATYWAVNPGAPQGWVFVASALACLAIMAAIWRRSVWERPTGSELFCVGASLAALVLWRVFREAFWAHMLVVAAVPLSFWPTWASVWTDRRREASPAWGLWTIGDLATVIVAARWGALTTDQGVGEFAYIGMELLCHASVWLMIGLATINPFRTLGYRNARLSILNRHRHAADLFRVADTHLGKAVFAALPFEAGETIVRFTGRRFTADRVPSVARGDADRYLQVGDGRYLGPSGRIDDLINHSCDPNAGLRFSGETVNLVAIRPIAAGEEIAWDYSTTLKESNWHMICQCRSTDCRRVIGNFATLSDDRQEWFRSHNLVAPYLRRRDDTSRDRAA